MLLRTGRMIAGSYIENGAFNPSLSPLQVALVNLVASGSSYEDVRAAILVENKNAKFSHRFAMASINKRFFRALSRRLFISLAFMTQYSRPLILRIMPFISRPSLALMNHFDTGPVTSPQFKPRFERYELT